MQQGQQSIGPQPVAQGALRLLFVPQRSELECLAAFLRILAVPSKHTLQEFHVVELHPNNFNHFFKFSRDCSQCTNHYWSDKNRSVVPNPLVMVHLNFGPPSLRCILVSKGQAMFIIIIIIIIIIVIIITIIIIINATETKLINKHRQCRSFTTPLRLNRNERVCTQLLSGCSRLTACCPWSSSCCLLS